MRNLAAIACLSWIVAGCGGGSTAAPPDAAVDSGAVVDAEIPPDGSVEVPLTGCGYSYTGEFAIGGTSARLVIDTGSPTLAVASSACVTCSNAGISPPYTPGTSARDLDLPIATYYGAGNQYWKGELYEDQVSVGSLGAVTLAFGLITSAEQFFDASCGQPQGIVGLSPMPEPAPYNAYPMSFPQQLAAGGSLDEFAMHFCHGTGNLWLNGYDINAMSAAPIWTPMTQDDLYRVELEDVAVAGHSVGVPASSYGAAVVDSGGPNLLLPVAAYQAVTKSLASTPAFAARFGAAFFTSADCVTLPETPDQLDAELPTLTVKIGSPAIAIELPATAAYLQAYATTGGTSYCKAINYTGVSNAGTDLGNTLIRAGVVVFDRARSRLGYAQSVPCP